MAHHFHNCLLSCRIINPSHKNSIRLTIQYNNQIHNSIWTIITKLQNQIQKVKKISCRRNWLNFIHFLSIQLHSAEKPKIKYIHRLTSNIVLNIVIKCPSQIGFHFILLCISQKIQAHARKNIINFFIFIFELINKYRIGMKLHIKAEIKIHRFRLDEKIEM